MMIVGISKLNSSHDGRDRERDGGGDGGSGNTCVTVPVLL